MERERPLHTQNTSISLHKRTFNTLQFFGYLLIIPNIILNTLQVEGADHSFAEVLYFFQLEVTDNLGNPHAPPAVHTLAMTRTLYEPSQDLLEVSKGTLVSCKQTTSSPFKAINVKTIMSVVAAVPHEVTRLEGADGPLIRYGEPRPAACFIDDRLAMVPKPGQFMTGLEEVEDGGDDDE